MRGKYNLLLKRKVPFDVFKLFKLRYPVNMSMHSLVRLKIIVRTTSTVGKGR